MSKSEGLMPPVHPGEVLREDFMKPLGLTVNRLALELHVPATRIGGSRDARCCSANQDLANSRSDLTSFSFDNASYNLTQTCPCQVID